MFWQEHWTNCNNFSTHPIDDSDKEILIELTPGDSTLQGYNDG